MLTLEPEQRDFLCRLRTAVCWPEPRVLSPGRLVRDMDGCAGWRYVPLQPAELAAEPFSGHAEG